MEYPRVTEILNAFTHFDQVPKRILDKAAARGTSVHALCAGIAKGAWIPDAMIDEEFIGYVNSFKKWKDAQVKEFTIIEKRYEHVTHGYTGQLDAVIIANDDKTYLVDFKTGSKSQKTFPVQMAAYQNLLLQHGINVDGAMLIYLSKDGEFPNIELITDFEEHINIFFCALTCWKYFNKRKKHDNRVLANRSESSS